MKKIILISCCLLLSSCSNVSRTYTPSGQPAYTINCSGTKGAWDKCFQAAGRLCDKRGYKILDKSSEDTVNAKMTSDGFVATKSNERTMLISCGR